MDQVPAVSIVPKQITSTIDSVLRTDPAPPQPPTSPPSSSTLLAPAPTRPARPVVTPRPSWIGPLPLPRQPTPGLVAMRQPVTIQYSSPGLQPPVFIFTSLSDPPWEAVEMDSQKNDQGQYRFSKAFVVEEGEYQYKFRLGPGDWWAFDESKPVADDGAGNKNNLLVIQPAVQATPVSPPTPAAPVDAAKAAGSPAKTSEPRPVVDKTRPSESVPPTGVPVLVQKAATIATPKLVDQSSAPQQPAANGTALPPDRLLPFMAPSSVAPPVLQRTIPALSEQKDQSATMQRFEAPPLPPTNASPQASSSLQTSASPLVPPVLQLPSTAQPTPVPQAAPVLIAPSVPQAMSTHSEPSPEDHAVLAPLMKHETFAPEDETMENLQDEDDVSTSSDYEDDDEQESHHSPLLRHESIAPDSAEQTQAPLLQHESTALGEHMDEPEHFSPRSYSSNNLSPLKSRSSSAVSFSPLRLSRRSTLAPEADPNDPSLEMFPTDHGGILEKIRRASNALPVDETTEDVNMSPLDSVIGDIGLSSTEVLPSVSEDREEEMRELEKIDDTEAHLELEQLRKIVEKEAEDEAESEEMKANELVITVVDVEERPAAPITPPMTPKEREEIVEQLEEIIIKQNIQDGEDLRETGALDVVQDKGFAGTLLDLLTHPAARLVAVGLAVAVAAGFWKLQFA